VSVIVGCIEVKIVFLKPEEEKDKTHFTDKEAWSCFAY